MNKITVLDWDTVSTGDISKDEIFSDGNITFYGLTSAEQTAERIGDSPIVLCNKVLITEEIMDACPDIRYIGFFNDTQGIINNFVRFRTVNIYYRTNTAGIMFKCWFIQSLSFASRTYQVLFHKTCLSLLIVFIHSNTFQFTKKKPRTQLRTKRKSYRGLFAGLEIFTKQKRP